MSWWESLPSAGEMGASLREKAETLKTQASEQAEAIKSRAAEEATKIQEKAEKIREDYVTDEALESVGLNALLGRAPVPSDGDKWDRAVTALDLTYVTDRVVAMGMPYDRRSEMIAQAKEQLGAGPAVKRRAGAPTVEKPGNNVDVVSSLLNHAHPEHYMVWNVSEEAYDYVKFNDQVLEFKFPGHPAPPLGLLFKICTSMENWLDSDPKNVACMHCLTGKGRTATILACYLTWAGEAGSVMEALHFVAQRRNDHVEKLTIPSQRRYLQYFSNMLDGVKPRSDPLLLRRIIMNTIPKFGTQLGAVRDPSLPKSELDDGSLPPGDPRDLGCCPYIQLFKGGKLVFTAAWQSGSTSTTTTTTAAPSSSSTTLETGGRDAEEGGGVLEGGSSSPKASTGPAWCYPSDSSVAFSVDAVLQGDILVRCRHLTSKGARVSMFRAAFHTGYVPCGVLRLNKAQLDGACTDDRFDDDFFIDLIFAPVTSRPPSVSPSSPLSGADGGAEKVAIDGARGAVDLAEPPSLSDSPAPSLPAAEGGAESGSGSGGGGSQGSLTSPSAPSTLNTAAARRERGVVVEPEARDAYDEMLHRDGRFWDEIAARKDRAAARRAAKASAHAMGDAGGGGGTGGGCCRGAGGAGDGVGGCGAHIGGVGAGAFGFDDEDHVNDDDDDDNVDFDDDSGSGVAVEFDLPGGAGMGYRKSQMNPTGDVPSSTDGAAGSSSAGSEPGSGGVTDALDFIARLGIDSPTSSAERAGTSSSGGGGDSGVGSSLLDQLAAVDDDDDDLLGGSDAGWVDAEPDSHSPTNTVSSLAPMPSESKEAPAATPSAATTATATTIATSSSGANEASTPQTAEVDHELLALEELEKELGVGLDADAPPPALLSTTPTSSAGQETAPATSTTDEMDDLEDFEGYLASLTAPEN